jgi:2-C-methyl-D-erythritol 4-phosphate cytidylyltransferase
VTNVDPVNLVYCSYGAIKLSTPNDLTAVFFVVVFSATYLN